MNTVASLVLSKALVNLVRITCITERAVTGVIVINLM